MKINREWHEQNRMPKNASLAQRVDWHIAHLKACSCRTDLPPKIREEIAKRSAP
jgi:hypothetical protein